MLKLSGKIWQPEMLRSSWKQFICGLMKTYSFITPMRTDVDLLEVTVNDFVYVPVFFLLLLSYTKMCNSHRVMEMTKLCKKVNFLSKFEERLKNHMD